MRHSIDSLLLLTLNAAKIHSKFSKMSIPELLRNHRRVAGPLLALHGPNLNLLGEREPHLYGRGTLAELDQYLIQHARAARASLRAFAGLTHTSIAVRDALDDCASGAENRHQGSEDNGFTQA